ncbi:MAG: 50S ribosomal protein L29 [Candidatus Aenigmarchaeota archaeon]|nr:50S ribosomal protein L29 [Candidatus Aenigmarchaeota archaeon]
MAILRLKEIRALSPQERDRKLAELNLEVAKERANIAVGAAAVSPGKIREIRKTIARIHTIAGQENAK